MILLICLSACTISSTNNDELDDKNKISEQAKTEDKYSGTDAMASEGNNKTKDQNANIGNSNKPSDSGNTDKTGSTNTGSSNNSGNSGNSGSSDNSGSTGSNEKPKEQHCHYETETYLIREGYYENVLVKEAWTEEEQECASYGPAPVEVYVCNTCGYRDRSSAVVEEHTGNCGTLIRDENPETGKVFEYWSGSSYHNEIEYIGEETCNSWCTITTNHPAEYKQVWHEPEYGTRKVQVCD